MPSSPPSIPEPERHDETRERIARRTLAKRVGELVDLRADRARRLADALRHRLADGRLVEIPEDRTLALHGLTPAPLPARLLTAAGALLSLIEGTPHHAH